MRTTVLGLAMLVLAAQAPAQAAGWRTDGTGRYLDADPPTSWSASQHVLWKTPMPGWGNATPVLAGGKLLVCSEPTTLVCLDANNGRILWQRENTYLDTLSAEERPKVQALLDQIDLPATTRQFRDARGKLSGAEAALKKTPGDANLARRKTEWQTKVNELQDKLKPVERFVLPETQDVNGFSSPTPVSDGQCVWVLFGTGTAACYDLDGNRKWIRFIEKPTDAYGHSASPLLVGDKLIVHVQGVVALNKDTGQQVWRSPAPAGWGTSVVAQVAGQPVIVTPKGQIFLAADGRKIADKLAQLAFNGPVVADGVAYFIEHKSVAFRLPPGLEAKPEKLWSCELPNDRYYAAPLVHDGLVYDVTQAGVFCAIDISSGTKVYQQKLDFGRPKFEQVYSAVTLAGKYLYLSTSSGLTIVAEAGRQYKPIALNNLGEVFRCCPVFVGKRMYLRSLKHTWCIGG